MTTHGIRLIYGFVACFKLGLRRKVPKFQLESSLSLSFSQSQNYALFEKEQNGFVARFE